MPPLVFIEMVLALSLYTFTISGLKTQIQWRYIITLLVALGLDWHASVWMIRRAGGHWSLHGAFGFATLILMTMFCAFVAAILFQIPEHKRKWQRLVGRVGVALYTCWVIAFLAGALTSH